tara:strand:- start:8844 stop:9635 length:792 start_codon:yes stop_codon:yes gene_type:complete
MNDPSTREILTARNISVRVGPKPLLKDVDFTLLKGSVHAIIGPNGAGKSTLLRVLTGESAPATGEVRLDNKLLHDYPNFDLAKRRACLPQSSSLSFPFTIREVVEVGRLPYRESNAETQSFVESSLERVGLLDRADEGYLHLSGGEKQRVHLARVLTQLGEPKDRILILDEPTASLDLTFQHQVFAIAHEWALQGAAVLLVLHDLNQTMRFAESVTVLNRGSVCGQGAPIDVLTPELIHEVYQVHAQWVSSGHHQLLAVDGAV